jgi:predicted ferric reductase
LRAVLIWLGVAAALVVPIAAAAASPLLAWRDPVYIAAGFAGIVALGLLLLQPLLAAGYLPGVRMRPGRRLHAWVGAGIIVAVVVHVAALWLTSPPDVFDALLLRSPTPFSVWGVVAMWAVFATGILAVLRGRLRLRLIVWRLCHVALAIVIVVGSVVHAALIDGTMEIASKFILCCVVLAAAAKVVLDRQLLAGLRAVVKPAGSAERRGGQRDA